MTGDTRKIPTRREFITTGAATVAVGALASTIGLHAATVPDKIRIGLVGCGGRGSGAAIQALHADPGVILVSMGDVLQSQIDSSLSNLKTDTAVADRIQVTPERCFVGLDAYRKVIDSGVDV